MRNEQKIDALRNEMNVRFESIDERFESMQKQMDVKFEGMDIKFESQQNQIDMIITMLFFVLGGLMSLIGFVIYDRRTAIKPVQKKQDVLEDILVEYSKDDKKLRDILKNAGIL